MSRRSARHPATRCEAPPVGIFDRSDFAVERPDCADLSCSSTSGGRPHQRIQVFLQMPVRYRTAGSPPRRLGSRLFRHPDWRIRGTRSRCGDHSRNEDTTRRDECKMMPAHGMKVPGTAARIDRGGLPPRLPVTGLTSSFHAWGLGEVAAITSKTAWIAEHSAQINFRDLRFTGAIDPQDVPAARWRLYSVGQTDDLGCA